MINQAAYGFRSRVCACALVDPTYVVGAFVAFGRRLGIFAAHIGEVAQTRRSYNQVCRLFLPIGGKDGSVLLAGRKLYPVLRRSIRPNAAALVGHCGFFLAPIDQRPAVVLVKIDINR